MHLIEESLCLGSIEDASDSALLLRERVTHVLSIRYAQVPENARSPKIKYEFIQALDQPHVDLLNSGRLDYAVEYMDRAIEDGGKILVNCDFGISRSTTLVVGYLMRKHSITVDEALDIVKKSRRFVCPNPGFMRQLRLYQEMGCKAKKGGHYDSMLYEHKLKKIPFEFHEKKAEKEAEATAALESSDRLVFKCVRCRGELFRMSHVIQHSKGATVTSIENYNLAKDIGGESDELCSFQYLVLPLPWMDLSDVRGRIACPGNNRRSCGAKLGHYDWCGRECMAEECGGSVRPWFCINDSKVDRAVLPEPSNTELQNKLSELLVKERDG